MARKRYTAEQLIGMMRQAEVKIPRAMEIPGLLTVDQARDLTNECS